MTIIFKIKGQPPRATAQQKGARRTRYGILFYEKDSVWHLETGQIATLVNHAVLGCMTCDNTTGKGCELKQILEELPIGITGDMLSAYMACADRLEVRGQ